MHNGSFLGMGVVGWVLSYVFAEWSRSSRVGRAAASLSIVSASIAMVLATIWLTAAVLFSLPLRPE